MASQLYRTVVLCDHQHVNRVYNPDLSRCQLCVLLFSRRLHRGSYYGFSGSTPTAARTRHYHRLNPYQLHTAPSCNTVSSASQPVLCVPLAVSDAASLDNVSAAVSPVSRQFLSSRNRSVTSDSLALSSYAGQSETWIDKLRADRTVQYTKVHLK